MGRSAAFRRLLPDPDPHPELKPPCRDASPPRSRAASAARRSVTFAQPLTFTRGYVTLVAHNHATWKYAVTFGNLPRPMRSWNVFRDNIGFDGPLLDQTREYETADALVPDTETTTDRSVEFATRNIHPGYPNGVLNLDLLVDFEVGRVFRDGFE